MVWNKLFSQIQFFYEELRLYFGSLCVHQDVPNGNFIILLMYIDVILLFGWDMSKTEKLKEFSMYFDMKVLRTE